MNKYIRQIRPVEGGEVAVNVDVYCVLEAFAVTCPARAHAIKKLLCTGIRGKGDADQDLAEAIAACQRAADLEKQRNRK